MDPRLKQLSYSSLLTLHSCPRKYQLYKLNTKYDIPEDIPGSLTFAYGHTVGKGIQDILEHKSLSTVLWEAYIEWAVDLEHENPKQNKSFWGALAALKQFHSMHSNGYLDGYELMYHEGKPACELGFAIHFPDGFIYRGFVDAVLKHTVTGEVMVLEVKTTNSSAVNPAQYKNSAQAIGYSIVLDTLAPALSSYKVLYLVYQTKAESFIQLPFEKSYYSRALWIRELLLDIETLKLYDENEIYPMHGESCYNYFRECEYLTLCTLSTERLASPLPPDIDTQLQADRSRYQIHITIDDLIRSQLTKESNPPPPDDDDIL